MSQMYLTYVHVGWVYLAVELLVQLTDALSQFGHLLSNDSMVDCLSSVCLHIKILWHKITEALYKKIAKQQDTVGLINGDIQKQIY